jgi:hypothetical protein
MNDLMHNLAHDIYKASCIKLAAMSRYAAAKGIPNPTGGAPSVAGSKLPKISGSGQAPAMAMPALNQNVANGLTQVTNNVPTVSAPAPQAQATQTAPQAKAQPQATNGQTQVPAAQPQPSNWDKIKGLTSQAFNAFMPNVGGGGWAAFQSKGNF